MQDQRSSFYTRLNRGITTSKIFVKKRSKYIQNYAESNSTAKAQEETVQSQKVADAKDYSLLDT